jgi:hypothetical protein
LGWKCTKKYALLTNKPSAYVGIPTSGANPTIASYNASVVKTYSAVNSLAHF